VTNKHVEETIYEPDSKASQTNTSSNPLKKKENGINLGYI